MKRSTYMKTYLTSAIAACTLIWAASPAFALDYYLAAKAYTTTLPDGTTNGAIVPMWGYVEDPGGTCYNATDNQARLNCIASLPIPALPGPRITVPPGEPLTIFLSNGLPETTSIIIPGQARPSSTVGNGPTWNDNTTGPRTNAGQKVRSYGVEAAANGGREQYVWSNIARSGTYLYHSGTHPQKQVYMGLYGAITKDASANEVYPGVSYDDEVILFYSDIDPAINNAIANGTYTTSIDYQARWFLINGKPYDPANKASPEMSIPAGAAGSNTLVRFLSTASETHVPTLQGLYATIHGEDGLRYNYQAGGVSMPSPRVQYSIELPPLKTKDAIVSAPADGIYAVYDGNGYMTNPSDPADPNDGDTVGGMLRFLDFSVPAQPPSAIADTNTASEGGTTVTGNVLSNDSPGTPPVSVTAANQGGTPITLGSAFATASGGSLTLNADGSYDYTPPVSGSLTADVDEVFSYTITDSTSASSNATLTITVNHVPVDTVSLYFSTVGNTNPPGVGGTADNSDIYLWNGTAFSRIFDATAAGVPDGANVDGLQFVDATHVYLSFSGNVTLPNLNGVVGGPTGPRTVQDEDIVFYNAGAWSVYFNGTDPDNNPVTPGLTGENQDIDAFSIIGGSIYFSTFGNVTPPGVGGTADDADIYLWNGTAFSRIFDATAAGVPSGANVDGLQFVDATHFYLTFVGNVILPNLNGVVGGPTEPRTAQDEDVVFYNAGAWSVHFDGTAQGLIVDNQDLDGINVQ
jgi:hypothetical protein